MMRALLALAAASLGSLALAAPIRLEEQAPVAVTRIGDGHWLVDFGRVAFGNLQFDPRGRAAAFVVHFGEAQTDGRVNRNPPGTVRHTRIEVRLDGEKAVVAAPPDPRNTKPPAILTPPEWGVLAPFRWIEIEGWPGELAATQLRRRAAFDATWDDGAASFACSDETLNRVWDLCRYSIKATTFAGVFVDGDRERIPYEADAYLNQLSYHACNPRPEMARDTFAYLLRHPTWPTEWAPQVIFMARADWMQTGDRAWLAAQFDALKPKLQLERAGADGLLASTAEQIRWGDIVDWPQGERDDFEFRETNTVVNAFHLRALADMALLARALGRDVEAADYEARHVAVRRAFQEKFFDASRGLFRDGAGTEHASVHANLFPLAFGLVPAGEEPRVVRWLASRGMACSVYAAQYLLEGLFAHGAADDALRLIAAPGDRSWRHMLESGATITWEAWDQRYKPNQDWNHAWGAAPANLLPRFVLGVQATAPGWKNVRVHPTSGALTWCRGRVPTPRGPIDVSWQRGGGWDLSLNLPDGTEATVELPVSARVSDVRVNGRPVKFEQRDDRVRLEQPLRGRAEIAVRVATSP